jgi:hypothetical protein
MIEYIVDFQPWRLNHSDSHQRIYRRNDAAAKTIYMLYLKLYIHMKNK